MKRRDALAAVTAIAAFGACARARPVAPLTLAVLIDGEPTTAAAVAGDLDNGELPGFTLRRVELPRPRPTPIDRTAAAVAAARAAYLERGDFEACVTSLEPVGVPPLLASGRRDLAARVLVWRAACAWGRMARAETESIAAQLAGFGLELPPDAGAVTPDVEAVLVAALDRAGATPRVPLTVAGHAGAGLGVDGRPAECVLPCTVEVTPGDHVVAVDADGFEPLWRLVRAPAAAPFTPALAPAAPALAVVQWRARTGRGLRPDDDDGLALVARAVEARRVLYLGVGARLRGALIVDGVVKARGERPPRQALALARDLTVRGGLVDRVPLHRRPRFWLAIGAAALVAATITAAILIEPEIHTEVGF